jgi:hypothetical protein
MVAVGRHGDGPSEVICDACSHAAIIDQDRRMTIVDALAALTEGDRRRAEALAADVDTLLGRALTTYLASEADGTVYDRPAAFQAFIDGGGNVGLYEAVAGALAGLYARERPAHVLDIGCGDGRALLPALAATTTLPSHLTLVEPSQALLATAVGRLHDRFSGISLDVHNARVERILDETQTAHFAVAQSTFALHALRPDVRDGVLAALAGRVGVLAIVEFDVPALEVGDRLEFLAETYARGLAEYDADRDLVAQGFLMPVLTGQLLPGEHRSTWEQPASRWVDQVVGAGFVDVDTTPLFDYWSSPAFLLTATGRPAD